MVFLIIFLLVALVPVIGYKSRLEISSRKTYGIGTKKLAEFSEPSKKIIAMYEKLPVANRPYSDIYYMLSALDTKFNIEEINRHFSQENRKPSGYSYTTYRVFSWNCSHNSYRRHDCQFQEFLSIKSGIESILSALKEQEHALKVAGIAHGLTGAQDLIDKMEEEREIIANITKELT